MLIDGGSSDNFLQPRIAKFLKLPIEPAPLFRVVAGNGNYMQAEGLVKNIQVEVRGYNIQLPMYLLPVSGANLLLGTAWLATIGLPLADYQSLQLKF